MDCNFFLIWQIIQSIHPGIYDRADYYIKRMLLKSDYRSNNKLLPFGLNYGVYYKNNYLKTLFLKDWKAGKILSSFFQYCLKNFKYQELYPNQ